jgi:hypothetical protein
MDHRWFIIDGELCISAGLSTIDTDGLEKVTLCDCAFQRG